MLMLASALTGIGAAGCLGFGSRGTPVKSYYVLNEEEVEPWPQPLFHGLVRVRNLNTDEIYEKFQIIVRKSPYELRYSDLSVWAVKPYQMVADIIAATLEDSLTFENVTRELGDSRPEYTMAGDLHAIEIYDSDDVWYAHLAFSLTLHRYATGEHLWSYSFDERKLLAQPSFSVGVRALSELLQMAMKEVGSQLEQVARSEDGHTRDVEPARRSEGQTKTPHPRSRRPRRDQPIYVPETRTSTPAAPKR
jgi:ABC-type uncharacterized transport system auxiliary subunit